MHECLCFAACFPFLSAPYDLTICQGNKVFSYIKLIGLIYDRVILRDVS